jgi:hypothetical protein
MAELPTQRRIIMEIREDRGLQREREDRLNEREDG